MVISSFFKLNNSISGRFNSSDKKIDISIEPFEVPEFSGFWTEELYRPNQIKFKKVDLRGSDLVGAKIGIENFKELVVDFSQAVYLASLLGLIVKY